MCAFQNRYKLIALLDWQVVLPCFLIFDGIVHHTLTQKHVALLFGYAFSHVWGKR